MSPFNSNYNSRLLRNFPACIGMENDNMSNYIMPISIWFKHCIDDICNFIPNLHQNVSDEINDSIFSVKSA